MYANFRRLYILVVQGGRKFPWLHFHSQFLYTWCPSGMEHGMTGGKNGNFYYSASFKIHYCFISSLIVKLDLDSFSSCTAVEFILCTLWQFVRLEGQILQGICQFSSALLECCLLMELNCYVMPVIKEITCNWHRHNLIGHVLAGYDVDWSKLRGAIAFVTYFIVIKVTFNFEHLNK